MPKKFLNKFPASLSNLFPKACFTKRIPSGIAEFIQKYSKRIQKNTCNYWNNFQKKMGVNVKMVGEESPVKRPRDFPMKLKNKMKYILLKHWNSFHSNSRRSLLLWLLLVQYSKILLANISKKFSDKLPKRTQKSYRRKFKRKFSGNS